jgi:hypothetical protein
MMVAMAFALVIESAVSVVMTNALFWPCKSCSTRGARSPPYGPVWPCDFAEVEAVSKPRLKAKAMSAHHSHTICLCSPCGSHCQAQSNELPQQQIRVAVHCMISRDSCHMFHRVPRGSLRGVLMIDAKCWGSTAQTEPTDSVYWLFHSLCCSQCQR